MPMQKRFHDPAIMWKLGLLRPSFTSGKPKAPSHRTEGAAHYSYWESLEKFRKLTWLSSRVQTRLPCGMQIARISLLPAQLPCCSSLLLTTPVSSPGVLHAEESHTPHIQPGLHKVHGTAVSKARVAQVWIPISPRHLTLWAVSIQLKYWEGSTTIAHHKPDRGVQPITTVVIRRTTGYAFRRCGLSNTGCLHSHL